MRIQDCYKILGIEETFDKKVIKSAYRKRVLILHPDKNNKSTTHEFIELKKAYNYLMRVLANDFTDEILLKNRYSKIYNADKIYKEKIKRNYKKVSKSKVSSVNNSKNTPFFFIVSIIALILFLIILLYVHKNYYLDFYT
jgi:curved DNA-binding protein CbpA